jgi:hypothetical protein
MTKKEIFLISIVVALAGLYVVYFSDWFAPKFIRIEHTVRGVRGSPGANARANPNGKQVNTVMFSLQKDYKLTAVKVVPAAAFQTNKYAHPLWHLVSKNGSEPIKGFSYGFALPGMSPAVPNAEPDPLEPGVDYRLIVETRKLEGGHDFSIPPLPTGARR